MDVNWVKQRTNNIYLRQTGSVPNVLPCADLSLQGGEYDTPTHSEVNVGGTADELKPEAWTLH